MSSQVLEIKRKPEKSFMDKIKEILPDEGNLNLCLTCGLCASGCPASGLENMDPRKFLRMAALGMDEAVMTADWAWWCTMCMRCIHACPMKIDIPALVANVRKNWPKEKQPKGIRGSCDMALRNDTCSAMGATEEDWRFVVEDVAEEVRDTQVGFENLQAPMDKKSAYFYLNQNSREPVTEPDEMIPLWKILHEVGADWTYGAKGWAAENYCLFCQDFEGWEHIVRVKAKAVDDLGCKVWLNTE